MINFKKGTGHTLLQSDFYAPFNPNVTTTAGMITRYDATNSWITPAVQSSAATDLLGFAFRNSTDNDVIESTQIAMILLDGNSVIETDQTVQTITAANYPIGTKLMVGGTNGLVDTQTGSNRTIGTVEGIRQLPNTTVVTAGVAPYGTVAVLAIKLNV